MSATQSQHAGSITVWDPLVRIGHWTLVATFCTSWLSGDEWQSLHVWSGYLLGCVLLARILWGFVGTRYARFSDFVRSPATVRQYLRDLARARPAHYIGHNPAGGWMILILMASLGMTVLSGLQLYAVAEHAGPLAALDVPLSTEGISVSLTARAIADDDDHDRPRSQSAHKPRQHEAGEEFWEEIHEFFTNFTLMLILVHIAGVAVSSLLHRENLVRAMISGKKPGER